MKIEIKEKAIKDLKRIDKNDANKILKNIQKLSNYPNISNIKKLTNNDPAYRLRIGDYRVLFNIIDNLIIVYRIKHRKDAYK